jgi:hypothetical protein
MRRLVVDRFCINATRVTRLPAGLRRCAGANHQFQGWRFPLLLYGAGTEFLVCSGYGSRRVEIVVSGTKRRSRRPARAGQKPAGFRRWFKFNFSELARPLAVQFRPKT